SLTAAAAIRAHRFTTATGQVAPAGGNALAVTCCDVDLGDLFAADALGTTVVEAAGAIAAGGAIEVGADGKAVAKSAGVTVARALQPATAAGDLIEVLLIPN